MKKVFLLILSSVLLSVFLFGCAQEPTPVYISSIVTSEEITNTARESFVGSAASSEVDDVQCEVNYDTLTYKLFYNSMFTEDIINDEVIAIWEQYATDVAEASIEQFKSINDEIQKKNANTFFMAPILRFEFYNSDGSILFYETSKIVMYSSDSVEDWNLNIENPA